jgi:hemerythrin-like domain-containing protein
MRPTDVLKSEHRVIEQVLSCLEKLADEGDADQKLDATAARQILDFFGNFADQCHHGKEEQYLFPRLEARGLARYQGPTGIMLDEHEEGREHLRVLREALGDAAREDPGAVCRFVRHARAYAQLLRDHIFKEDQGLFPMANGILTPDDQQQLLESFARVESDHLGAGTHEKYLALAGQLAARFAVPAAAATPEAACCCHGH